MTQEIAGYFFASYQLMLMQDCPNLNYLSCAAVEHGPQKRYLFAPDHMQRGSASYLKPLRWLQDEHPVDSPTSLRVQRNKQTLIFAFIAAQCTQSIKIHTSSSAYPRKINALSREVYSAC